MIRIKPEQDVTKRKAGVLGVYFKHLFSYNFHIILVCVCVCVCVFNIQYVPFCKDYDKRESLNTKATQVKLQILDKQVHLISILASLKNSMRGLNQWLMVQVYEIAHIAINLAFHILIILNSFFPHFLSSWNVYECVNGVFICYINLHVLDLPNTFLFILKR